MRKSLKIFFWGLLLAGIFIRCDELPCPNNNGVKLNTGFYLLDGSVISDTIIDTLVIKLLNKDIDPYSDTLYKVQAFAFPLSMIADSSSIVFSFKDRVKDTLTFHYNRMLTLESHQCGFDNFLEITKVTNTNNKLDSVWVSKDLVDYDKTENIKIYF